MVRIILSQGINSEKKIYMSEDIIKKNESDLLSIAINRIISSEVLENDMVNQLPLTDDLTDSNKIYSGKASILFVDMRESTKLPQIFSRIQLVKIYRGYIRAVVQAIRYSDGVVRNFMGDGVLSVFLDSDEGNSEEKAVRAARYITTAIDKFLNPLLDQEIGHRISCGIGIHTGEISLSKVGMKGKEHQNGAEDEFGIAWIGNSTNLACKFSGAVSDGTIFISSSTYSALNDIYGKQNWERIEIYKDGNALEGYIAKQYYLQLDASIDPCCASNNMKTASLTDELKKVYQNQLAEIQKKSEILGVKECSLQDRECQLNIKAEEINRLERQNIIREQELNKREYRFLYNILSSGHCNSEYVKQMGQKFWEENLIELVMAGAKIGKSEHEVKQEVSYAMVSVYGSLNLYDKAYDFLVEQATGYSWLLLSVVQNIVGKVIYKDRLKTAVCTRLVKNDLSPSERLEFEKIEKWLAKKSM